MRPLHREHGGVSAEQIGVLVLIGAVVAAVWTLALPDRVEDAGEQAVECLFDAERGADCVVSVSAPPGEDGGEGDNGGGSDDDLTSDEALEAALERLPEGSRIVDATTGDVLWETGDPLPDDPELREILRALALTNEHLAEHGFDGIDGNGQTPLVLNINDPSLVNNAVWRVPDEETFYGPGMATPFVIAHEFGHGLVFFQIDFDRTDIQRAMNEGIADVVAYNVLGETELVIDGTVRRDMSDPAAHGMPFHVDQVDLNAGCTSPPCVHNNSSILSHAYYLMAEGSSSSDHARESHPDYEPLGLRGVGTDVAQEIFYDALPNLQSDSELADFRDEMLAAAARRDPDGTDGDIYREVQAALDGVGLDADFDDDDI